MEFYINNNQLIKEDTWQLKIDELRKNNTIDVNEEKEALEILDKYLFNAVKKRVDNLDRFGILFSGGLDSAIIVKICKDLGKDFTCYAIGFKDSKDLVYAKKAATLMNLKLKIKILNEDDLRNALINVVKILDNTNPVYISIACVSYLGLKFVKDSDENIVINGLGAEEIFCGYQRHLKASDEEIHEESWRGLREMWKVDLERDYLIAQFMDVNVRTPFMDQDLISNSMKIEPNLKISNSVKKIILRSFAKKINVPAEIADRPKSAGQYGSKINHEIKKLARKNNYKNTKDYLENLKKS